MHKSVICYQVNTMCWFIHFSQDEQLHFLLKKDKTYKLFSLKLKEVYFEIGSKISNFKQQKYLI